MYEAVFLVAATTSTLMPMTGRWELAMPSLLGLVNLGGPRGFLPTGRQLGAGEYNDFTIPLATREFFRRFFARHFHDIELTDDLPFLCVRSRRQPRGTPGRQPRHSDGHPKTPLRTDPPNAPTHH